MVSVNPDGSNIPKYAPRIEEQKSIDNTEVQDEAATAEGAEGQAPVVEEKPKGSSPFEIFSKGASKITQAADVTGTTAATDNMPMKPPDRIESPLRERLFRNDPDKLVEMDKIAYDLEQKYNALLKEYEALLPEPINKNSIAYKIYYRNNTSYSLENITYENRKMQMRSMY